MVKILHKVKKDKEEKCREIIVAKVHGNKNGAFKMRRFYYLLFIEIKMANHPQRKHFLALFLPLVVQWLVMRLHD